MRHIYNRMEELKKLKIHHKRINIVFNEISPILQEIENAYKPLEKINNITFRTKQGKTFYYDSVVNLINSKIDKKNAELELMRKPDVDEFNKYVDFLQMYEYHRFNIYFVAKCKKFSPRQMIMAADYAYGEYSKFYIEFNEMLEHRKIYEKFQYDNYIFDNPFYSEMIDFIENPPYNPLFRPLIRIDMFEHYDRSQGYHFLRYRVMTTPALRYTGAILDYDTDIKNMIIDINAEIYRDVTKHVYSSNEYILGKRNNFYFIADMLFCKISEADHGVQYVTYSNTSRGKRVVNKIKGSYIFNYDEIIKKLNYAILEGKNKEKTYTHSGITFENSHYERPVKHSNYTHGSDLDDAGTKQKYMVLFSEYDYLVRLGVIEAKGDEDFDEDAFIITNSLRDVDDGSFSLFNSNRSLYYNFINQAEAVDWYKNNYTTDVFHEVIYNSRPQKIKFDLDGCKDYEEVNKFIEAVSEPLFLMTGHFYTLDDIVVYNSSGSKKISFHIIFDGAAYMEANIIGKKIACDLKNTFPCVDTQIYKSVQNFRCPYATKEDRTKRLVKYDGTTESLNCFAEDKRFVFITGGYLTKSKVTVIEDEREIYKAPTSEIQAILDSIEHETKSHRFRCDYNNMLYFDRIEPSLCDICETIHDNDNTLMIRITPDKLIKHCRHNAEKHKELVASAKKYEVIKPRYPHRKVDNSEFKAKYMKKVKIDGADGYSLTPVNTNACFFVCVSTLMGSVSKHCHDNGVTLEDVEKELKDIAYFDYMTHIDISTYQYGVFTFFKKIAPSSSKKVRKVIEYTDADGKVEYIFAHTDRHKGKPTFNLCLDVEKSHWFLAKPSEKIHDPINRNLAFFDFETFTDKDGVSKAASVYCCVYNNGEILDGTADYLKPLDEVYIERFTHDKKMADEVYINWLRTGYGSEYAEQVTTPKDVAAEFLDWLYNFYRKHGKFLLIGFNTRNFDSIILLQAIFNHANIRLTNNGIIQPNCVTRLDCNAFSVTDLNALLMSSLDSACKDYGVKNSKIKFEKFEEITQHCTGKKFLSDEEIAEVEKYNRFDCYSMAELSHRYYYAISKSVGFSTKDERILRSDLFKDIFTVGQLALHICRTLSQDFDNVLKNPYKQNYLDSARKAMYAGRVDPAATYAEKKPAKYEGSISMFDITSSYPNALKNNEYPCGEIIDCSTYINDKFAIYHANIVKQGMHTTIPLRTPDAPLDWNHRGRINDVYITSVAYDDIVRNGGEVEILEGSFYWEGKTNKYFNEFVDRLFCVKQCQDILKEINALPPSKTYEELGQVYTGDGSPIKEDEETIRELLQNYPEEIKKLEKYNMWSYNSALRNGTKLLLNSLTGKLAQRESLDVYEVAYGAKETYIPMDDINTYRLNDNLLILFGTKAEKGAKTPCWLAAFMYDYARIDLMKCMKYGGLTSDTDSVILKKEDAIRFVKENSSIMANNFDFSKIDKSLNIKYDRFIPKPLGSWECEKYLDDATTYVIAKKIYAIFDNTNKEKPKYRMKGVPKSATYSHFDAKKCVRGNCIGGCNGCNRRAESRDQFADTTSVNGKKLSDDPRFYYEQKTQGKRVEFETTQFIRCVENHLRHQLVTSIKIINLIKET